MESIYGDPLSGRINPDDLVLDVPDIVRQLAGPSQFNNYLRLGGRENEESYPELGLDPMQLSILKILSSTPGVRTIRNYTPQESDRDTMGIPIEELRNFRGQ